MSTTTESKHSAGAVRAGERIRTLERQRGTGNFVSSLEMAAIIDRETAAPVMLEALEKIDELYSTQYPNAHMPEVSPYGLIPNVDGVGKAIGMVRDAIRLAKGGSSR